MTKLLTYLKYILLVMISLVFTISNINLYRPVYHSFQEDKTIVKNQLNYLDWSIVHGGPEMMQSLYPEGAFFLYSLYSLSWIQYANKFETPNGESESALEKARFGIEKMSSEFKRFEFLAGLNPPNGIFMNGWLNWARGSYTHVARKLGVADHYEKEFKEGCETISQAFEKSSTHYLESYYGSAWPSDNVIAIASLKLHDKLYEEKYNHLIHTWLDKVKQSLDETTGMIPYESDFETGQPLEGARGNAQAVIIRFLAEVDKEFTLEQYQRYNNNYQRNLFGLLFTKELPKGIEGQGTVDSGPIIFGVGTAASLVAQIPYRIFGDETHIKRLLGSLNACGFPLTTDKKTKYVLGYMPVADAFWVWGSLTETYTEEYDDVILNEPSYLWRLSYHFWSLMGILMCAILLNVRKTYRFASKIFSKFSARTSRKA